MTDRACWCPGVPVRVMQGFASYDAVVVEDWGREVTVQSADGEIHEVPYGRVRFRNDH